MFKTPFAVRCRMAERTTRLLVTGALLLFPMMRPTPALAWGDEGHEIIAMIANALLQPGVRRQVDALLALDEDPLAGHGIADAATWVDHLRDANADGARRRTRQWHFVDIERRHPSLAEACFGHPKLAPGVLASLGPAQACIVDKIDQFAAELARSDTPSDERLVALKFLLHLVGDVHQPLHASDDDDRGGNGKRVNSREFRAGNLHHYWDTEFVAALGPDAKETASSLLQSLPRNDIGLWSEGSPADWAMESFRLASRDAYGLLPEPNRRGSYRLDDHYVAVALRDCRLQLSKAGVRLAALLNRILRNPLGKGGSNLE